MANITAADLYGSEGVNLVGTKTQTSAISASGSLNNMQDDKGDSSSFSWMVFVGLLVLIRVLEEFTPSI